MKKKDCTKCGATKAVVDFYKRYGKPRAECKECTKKANTTYAESNADKIRKINADYREKNRDQIAEKQAKYREENKDLCKEMVLRWKDANYDTYIDYRKRYYRENREDILRKGQQYHIDNPHVRATQEQRRRARKASVVEDFTTQDWQVALEYFDNKCAYCRESSDNLQQEHVAPLVKRGAYIPENIIPSCPSCNLDKYTHDMVEWFVKKPFYTETAIRNIEYFIENVARRSCQPNGVGGK